MLTFKQSSRLHRGDTLIEVLLAITVFSAAAVGAIYIMNRGITTAQQSFEITQVRNQINNQAELIRHLNNLAITASGRITAGEGAQAAPGEVAAEWQKAIDRKITQAPDFDAIKTVDDCRPEAITSSAGTQKPFFINTKTGNIVPIATITPGMTDQPLRTPATFARIIDIDAVSQASEMIWMYAVYNPGAEARDQLGGSFYDFHIRACWDAPDGKNVQKLGTIVRLYAPN